MKLLTIASAAILFSACGDKNGETIMESGTLEATEVTVSALVGGTVRALPVDEGSTVDVGDTVALLDSEEWRLQLQQAEANLRATEAQYRLALEGPRKEDVVQAEANYESAKSDLRRMEELYGTKSVSEKQLEDARTRFTLAEQALAKMKRGSRQDEIEQARARRDQARAQAASLRKKVNDCVVTSPIKGTVTTRYVEVGELLGQGMSVVRVANLERLRLNIYVSETVLPRIQLGQKASVTVDAFEDRSFEGEIVFISPTAEFTPKNIQTKDERTKLVFAVKLRVLNQSGILKAGIPADVTILFGPGTP